MQGRRVPVPLVTAVLALVVGVLVIVLLLMRFGGPRFDPPVADTFEVNTYEWDGDAAIEARVSGVLAFTEGGCTLLISEAPTGPQATAIFFPNAIGVVYENGVRGVVDNRGRVFGIEGEVIDYGGGAIDAGEGLQTSWDDNCSDTPFTDAFMVQDATTRGPLTEPPAPPSRELPKAPTRM